MEISSTFTSPAFGDCDLMPRSDLFVLSKDERSVQVYLWSRGEPS